VVAGDTVYVANADGVVAGLDAVSGAERWRMAPATGPGAGLVVAGGTLFVVSGSDASRPAAAGGIVYAAGGGGNRRLHAVDPATGTERWSARLNRNGVYAFDAVTGSERWYLDTGNPVKASPVVDGDAVYAADGLLYRIDAGTGALRWQTQPSVPDQEGLAVAGSLLIVAGDDRTAIVDGMGRISGWLLALDAVTGDERWRIPIGGAAWSDPVMANGAVYVGTHDGNVLAVEEASGRERWRVSLGDPILGVALAGGVVYAVGSGGSVFALGEDCGEPAADPLVPGAAPPVR
jgi:outer membrane protein assembly factor BamB